MTIHALTNRPSEDLSRALGVFEEQFSYPLGEGRSFRISHGEDYPRFFRAMGTARSFIAENAGRVVGTLGIAIRPLMMLDGDVRRAAYIGDLKVSRCARGSMAFLRMALAGIAWARPQVTAAYGVVMEGTPVLPDRYSGRADIPRFSKVGKVLVIRFATAAADRSDGVVPVTAEQGIRCFQGLIRGHLAALAGTPAERSEMPPQWLTCDDGSACGRLEDTRRAKRLIDGHGIEMVSAHLADFACRAPADGAKLIQAARWQAAQLGFPALFVAIADEDWTPLDRALGPLEKVIAPATIYGAGLSQTTGWNINSSEI